MKKELTAKIDGRGFVDNTDIIDVILQERCVNDISELLNPTIDALIPYEKLININKAWYKLSAALDNGKSILIIADTDTDGCTAGAIMYRFLKQFTDNVKITINEGKEHGIEDFDMSICIADIVIIVDSINKAEHYKKFTDEGKEVIVLDHHLPPSPIEEYQNIILVSSANDYSNPELSGAGVAWKFCKYCDIQWLTDFADDLTDLAATGIIADMCDMSVPENRYICYTGLKNLQNTGIRTVIGSYVFDSQSVSFSIAPLINACQRMNQNKIALQLFITDLPDKTEAIVDKMKKIKEQQNELVEILMPELIQLAETQLDNKCMSFTIDTEYGISGLLANKLMDIYHRPILVLKHIDGQYAGSMRACGVDNFLAMVNDTRLATCEGHELAAGFFCDDENYHEFISEINNRLMNVEFEERCVADIELGLWQLNPSLIANIKAINFVSGKGFKPITILIRGIADYEVSSMSKGKHLKIVTDECLIIKWNYQEFDKFQGRPFNVIGGLNYGRLGRTSYMQVIADEFDFGENESEALY